MHDYLIPSPEKQMAWMYRSDQQIRLIQFSSLYGRLDTAKSLDKEVTTDCLA